MGVPSAGFLRPAELMESGLRPPLRGRSKTDKWASRWTIGSEREALFYRPITTPGDVRSQAASSLRQSQSSGAFGGLVLDYYEHVCRCGHRSRAEPGQCPDDPAWTVRLSERHLAGPMLVALICALSLRMRLSRRRIQEFFADWFGLQLSVATINQCLHEAGRAVEPVVEEQLLAEIRASDLLYADETSWKEHGQLLWLWVFTSATTTVFTIGRRTQALLHSLLGSALAGWLMSDGDFAYRDYDNRLRCLTHLLRKARGLQESLDPQARELGNALHQCLETVMDAVYAAREGPPPVALRAQHAHQINALFELCLRHAEAKHEKTRALARELLNDWDTFPECRVSLVIPRGSILLPRGLGRWRQPSLPGFALRSLPYPTPRWSAGHDSALKWLDGVWDALCVLPPRLRDSRPFATAATRSRPRLPGTTRLRFALLGAQRGSCSIIPSYRSPTTPPSAPCAIG